MKISMENIRGVDCVNYRPEMFVDLKGNPIFTKQFAFYFDSTIQLEVSDSPLTSSCENRNTFRLKCNGDKCTQALNVFRLPSRDGLKDIASVSSAYHIGKSCAEVAIRHRRIVGRWQQGLEIAEKVALAEAAEKGKLSISLKLKQISYGITPCFKTLYNQLSPYRLNKKRWILQNGTIKTINQGTKDEEFVFQQNPISCSTVVKDEVYLEPKPLLDQPSDKTPELHRNIFSQPVGREFHEKYPATYYLEQNKIETTPNDDQQMDPMYIGKQGKFIFLFKIIVNFIFELSNVIYKP